MTTRSASGEIPPYATLKKRLCVCVDRCEFLQEVARHLHLAEAIKEHRQRQIHQCNPLFIALIELYRGVSLLDRGIDKHELIAPPKPVVFREAEHLLAFLRCETKLACCQKGLQIGEAQEHIWLRRGHRPKLADVLLGEHPLLLELRRCLARQILVVMHAVVCIFGKILDLHAGSRKVVRLHAQNALDDAIALLARLLSCTCDEFVCSEGIYLTRQIRILTQPSAEI